MKLNKAYIENRIANLERNYTQNINLIKKWKHYLRRCEK